MDNPSGSVPATIASTMSGARLFKPSTRVTYGGFKPCIALYRAASYTAKLSDEATKLREKGGVFKKFFQALMTHCKLEYIPRENILHFLYFVGKRKLDKEWRQNISKAKENFSVNEHILNIVKKN